MENYIIPGLKPFGATPNAIQLQHLKWGKKAFFHFGINTFTNVEWGSGTEAEQAFNPTDCDVRSWVKTARDAGCKLAILTAKHHDGFCLWRSEHTEHSIAQSPYRNGKGDLVREFTDACNEYGIKPGIYISPWDRHSPDWGTDRYSDVFAAQLTELMTGYGEIFEVWWDGAGSCETEYRWADWVKIIREHQPNAGIFGSLGATPFVDFRWVGNERGYAGEPHYASINPKYLETETPAQMNIGEIGAPRYIPAEVNVSVRPGWFYHKDQDDKVKTALELDRIWFDSVGHNAMMLLNFPPAQNGRIYPIDAQNAIESNRHIETMLATDFLNGATVVADNVLSNETAPENLLSDDDAFYAADRNTAVLDLFLKGGKAFNVLLLGEKVEYGERISNYRLESVGEKIGLLADGTSVGYRKAIRFEPGDYRHLRLTVTGKDVPVLRTVSAHYYPYADVLSQPNTPDDVMMLSSATVEFSEDRMEVRLAFGGIYAINYYIGHTETDGEVTLYTFDGVTYTKSETVSSRNGQFTIVAKTETCYQVKLKSTVPFCADRHFFITKI